MADYREHDREIRAAGAQVVAVSVDPPKKSESLRAHLSLPFPILCDTERYLVKLWDVYNPGDKGGIAKPSVFLVDQDRIVRYASVNATATRITASQIVRLLQSTAEAPRVRSRFLFPLLSDWRIAIRNLIG